MMTLRAENTRKEKTCNIKLISLQYSLENTLFGKKKSRKNSNKEC